jgi:hypothetical protein
MQPTQLHCLAVQRTSGNKASSLFYVHIPEPCS